MGGGAGLTEIVVAPDEGVVFGEDDMMVDVEEVVVECEDGGGIEGIVKMG